MLMYKVNQTPFSLYSLGSFAGVGFVHHKGSNRVNIHLQSEYSRLAKVWVLVALGIVVAALAAVPLHRLYRNFENGTFRIGHSLAQSQQRIAVMEIRLIETQLHQFKSINGSYPTTEQGLAALVTRPTAPPLSDRWRRLLSAMPKDPWGSDYIYLCPGQTHRDAYDLYSSGPDRVANTADDVWGEQSNGNYR
jgi:general secretion pathway protein G